MLRRRVPALLLSLAFLAGCEAVDEPPPATVVVADDDDDATDEVDRVELIAEVTFAASLQGVLRPDPDRDGSLAELSGTWHVLYWADSEGGDLVCRQRFAVESAGVVDPEEPGLCEGCAGRMRVTSVEALPSEDFEDGCSELPPAIDLGFLILPTGELPDDFRQLDLVAWDALASAGVQLARGGLGADEVDARYAGLGLDIRYLALISPSGWLGEEAGLAEVASPWSEASLLPMFVVYRGLDEGGDGDALEGPVKLSSLWTVQVGDSVTAGPAN